MGGQKGGQKMAQQRTRYKLKALFVKSAPIGKHSDGGGLYLHKHSSASAKWFFRYTLHGHRHEMGLGSLSDVSLQMARELADAAREQVKRRVDPIQQRDRESRDAARSDISLRKIAEEAFEARKAELRDDGKAGRWFSPLELHILPRLGKVPVTEINQVSIRDTLEPIWHEKAPTASKAINRLGLVLEHAAALGLEVDIQATDKAKALLGKQRHQETHIDSMPWQEVPAFFASLREPTTAHLALRLLILTGHRVKPVRFLHTDHIEGDVWTAPPELLKGKEGSTDAFRCHLSPQAHDVIRLARPLARDGFLFPSIRSGVISDATMSRLMERRGLTARPHGFRTSMRVWLEDATSAIHEVKETMIQHKVDGKTVRTYRRTDYLEQRRPLYDAWAKFVTSKPPD